MSTDIVILLTPRIVRTHEVTQQHLDPIYIGSQMNLGLSGPTPVIGAEPSPAVPEPAPAAQPATAPPGLLPGNTKGPSGLGTPPLTAPRPGSSPRPGPGPPAPRPGSGTASGRGGDRRRAR